MKRLENRDRIKGVSVVGNIPLKRRAAFLTTSKRHVAKARIYFREDPRYGRAYQMIYDEGIRLPEYTTLPEFHEAVREDLDENVDPHDALVVHAIARDWIEKNRGDRTVRDTIENQLREVAGIVAEYYLYAESFVWQETFGVIEELHATTRDIRSKLTLVLLPKALESYLEDRIVQRRREMRDHLHQWVYDEMEFEIRNRFPFAERHENHRGAYTSYEMGYRFKAVNDSSTTSTDSFFKASDSWTYSGSDNIVAQSRQARKTNYTNSTYIVLNRSQIFNRNPLSSIRIDEALHELMFGVEDVVYRQSLVYSNTQSRVDWSSLDRDVTVLVFHSEFDGGPDTSAVPPEANVVHLDIEGPQGSAVFVYDGPVCMDVTIDMGYPDIRDGEVSLSCKSNINVTLPPDIIRIS